MSAYLFALYAVVHVVIFTVCLRLAFGRNAQGALLVAMIAGGLVYDNSIIALGSVIGVGPLLEALSWPRFIMHTVLTPFLMIAATNLALAGGVHWADTRVWRWLVWGAVLAFATVGVYSHLLGAEIYPACYQGVTRYTMNLYPAQFCYEGQEAVAGSGPPVASIVGNIVTLLVGFSLWRMTGWVWLMTGAIIMFAAAAVPVGSFGLIASNAGEVALLMCYAFTVARYSRAPAN